LDHERDLIEQAKQDPKAFAALYQHHYPMLLNYVYRRTGDVHATEDLVADVFVIVLRSLSGYRYRGVPLRFWLLRIATNTVNRWARRQRRRMRALTEADREAGRTVSRPSEEVDSEFIEHALLSLPPRYQTVLSLYHLEGLSVKETAAVIGCREGTVRSRLTRARGALRAKLNGRR
jgi:RNA polymerase sigma-70 factor (ECF subfamily)